ncbi:MAG TPA: methionine ABC transporter permease [Firmicutes bacterium]|nr:methionine ABC transporter permease [Bacillota bacterium]
MQIDFWKISMETLLMTFLSTILAYMVGLPLGVLLHITSKKGLNPNKPLNLVLGIIINFLRSVPCLILTVILLPLNRFLLGRGTGVWYTMIIPLFFSSFAYVARNVEQSLQSVDCGVMEAAKSLGASDMQIVKNVLLPEARSSLLLGVAITLVNVLGYTSFAYNIGAGGIISEIWSYYSKNTTDFLSSYVFWLMIVLVVVFVEVIQEFGLLLAKKLDKRKTLK